MKTFALLFLLFFSSKIIAQNTHDLTIKISGYTSLSGTIFIAVYNSEENYMNVSKASFLGLIKPKALTELYTFHNVPDGYYAATIFFDENNNGKLDTNFFGVPTEKNGFSNNAKGSFGPPKFEKAKFKHSTIEEIAVQLH